MSYVRALGKIGQGEENWAGEKAARLGELLRVQVDVPPGVVIGAPAYVEHIAHNQIAARIQSRLSETEMEDPVELETVAEEIRAWIEQAPAPAAIEEMVKSMLDTFDAGLFAVRASRVIEDVANPRASGLEQAFLGVPREQVTNYVRKAWATLWTSRAMYYRYHKNIAPSQVSIAVVIQAMVSSTAAGILFTANPLTGGSDQMHIDATFGLGEAIVAARWKADHYVVRKSDLGVIEREVVDKPLQVSVASGGGIEVSAVDPSKQSHPCLTDAQILKLGELGRRIEERFKQAQDIEWCFAGPKIAILQTRPLRKK